MQNQHNTSGRGPSSLSQAEDQNVSKQKKQKTKLQLKAPTQERSRQTVVSILEACSRLLIKDGFFGVTTDKVAKEAGVSIGSLYQFFGNKESVVSAVVQELSRKDLETFKSLTENMQPLSEPERVTKIVSAFFILFKSSHDLRVKIQSLQNYLLDQKFHSQQVLAFSDVVEKCLTQKPGRNNSRTSFVIVNTVLGFLNNSLENSQGPSNDKELQLEITKMIQAYTA
jgi:AcrR family transcriptional regulator